MAVALTVIYIYDDGLKLIVIGKRNLVLSHNSCKRSKFLAKSLSIFFGTSNSADFGITLSMRNQGFMNEYWCYSPVFSDVSDYGMLTTETQYRICWGAKEEIGMEDYFPNLLKDIRKRGGKIHSWVYNGGHDRDWWKYWFSEELKLKFPYKVK